MVGLFCLLSSVQSYSQPIDRYHFSGVTFFSQEFLQKRVDSLREDSVDFGVRRFYSSHGFWDVRVLLDNDTIRVEEGERYRIDSLQIDFDTVTSFPVVNDIYAATIRGQPYSDSLVEQVLISILERLNEQGYALAKINLDVPNVDAESHTVLLRVLVYPGFLVRIQDIKIEGNTKTSSSLILSALNLRSDAIFTDKLADEVVSRLQGLNLFELVEKPSLYQDDSSRFGLLIRIRERATNTFDGVLGYQPGTDTDDNGFFTGLVRIVLRNLFSGGERLSGKWERSDRTRSQLELGYSQPFLFGLPLDLSFGFSQIQEAETPALTAWVNRSFRTNIDWRIGDNLSMRTGGSIASVIPSPDTLLGPCSNRRLLNSSTLALTVGGQFDTRTDRINPTGGSLLGVSYTFGSKGIDDPEECLEEQLRATQSRRSIKADIETYVGVATPLVIAGIANFTDVDGDLLEESELIRFGGINSVRGYRDGQFRASRSAWGKLEGRLLLSPLSFVSLFFDGGYYSRPDDERLGTVAIDDVIYGYGVGLQIDTPVGITRFAFALGKGDSFEDGKVLVGILGDF